MKGSPWLLLALLFSLPAFAQNGKPKQPALPPNDQNTQLFRGLLHFHKVEPESVENVRNRYDYSNLIVVVLGDPRNQAVVNICRATLANGGAVLVAADTDLALSGYFPQGGDVRIAGTRLRASAPEFMDGGVPTRPVAVPIPSDEPNNPFSGIERVATNDPTYLWNTKSPPGLPMSGKAGFTLGSIFGQDRLRQAVLPLAMTSDGRTAARCMVVADPDVFTNRMIYTSGREENPTDNLKLANQTVQWLKGAGRTKCLFIENGEAKTKFDEFEFASVPLGPPMPPVPPVPVPNLLDAKLQKQMADAGNSLIDEAERNDAMNRGILSAARGRTSTVIAVLAGILLTVFYLIFRWRAVTGFVRKTFRPIPRDPAMIGPDVAVGSVEHRRLELLRSSDYGPVLRPVVRRLFEERGLPAGYEVNTLPPADIAVGRPQYLREALRSLWAVVCTAEPVGYTRWKELEPLLAAVRAAADDDRWRFVAPAPRDAAP